MITRKSLLMATAMLSLMSLPAFATDATAPAPDALGDAPPAMTMDAPPTLATDAPAALGAEPAPVDPAMAQPTMAPADMAAPMPTDVAPTEPAPMSMDAAPDMAAPAPMAEPTPSEPAVVAEPTPEPQPEPVVTETAPEPAPVVKKKVTRPVKLSALSKKYGLMDLDTNGNKSLSVDEFTANGFANEKVFRRYDADGNGKLTYGEVNAYAATIEANSKR